jgi:hypothetical protein
VRKAISIFMSFCVLMLSLILVSCSKDHTDASNKQALSVTSTREANSEDNTMKKNDIAIGDVEKRLIQGNYIATLDASNWAVQQGERIIPILEKMLSQKKKYRTEGHGLTGAFPFNAVWTLAHIPVPRSLKVLENYYTSTHDDDAMLAINGYKVRNKLKDPDCGVLYLDSCNLNSDSSTSTVIQVITKGQMLKVLKYHIENNNEHNRRGGSQVYDYVELMPEGTKGYIPREGDDFSPVI